MAGPAGVNALCFEALKINPTTIYGIYFQKSNNLELWRYQNKRLKWSENKQDRPFVFLVILDLIP